MWLGCDVRSGFYYATVREGEEVALFYSFYCRSQSEAEGSILFALSAPSFTVRSSFDVEDTKFDLIPEQGNYSLVKMGAPWDGTAIPKGAYTPRAAGATKAAGATTAARARRYPSPSPLVDCSDRAASERAGSAARAARSEDSFLAARACTSNFEQDWKLVSFDAQPFHPVVEKCLITIISIDSESDV